MSNPIAAIRWAGYSEDPIVDLRGAHLDFQVFSTKNNSSTLGTLADLSRIAEDRFSRGFNKESMHNVVRASISGDSAAMSYHITQLQRGVTEAAVFSNLGKAVVSAADSLIKTS
jgi:hypothetical protein